jgi:ketosteroid isomerase-like protein
MSEENLTRLKAAIEVFNKLAANPEAIDAAALRDWLAFMDPDIRFEPQQAALQGTYTGHSGAGQWIADIAAHYEDGHMEMEELRDLGDRVLGLGTIHVIGKGSGIQADVPTAVVVTFRDGLMTRFQDFGPDTEAAVEAAEAP